MSDCAGVASGQGLQQKQGHPSYVTPDGNPQTPTSVQEHTFSEAAHLNDPQCITVTEVPMFAGACMDDHLKFSWTRIDNDDGVEC